MRALACPRWRARARTSTFATDPRACVAAYIKERSSVRPIFHACIAILDAYDASGTRLKRAFPSSPDANQTPIHRIIRRPPPLSARGADIALPSLDDKRSRYILVRQIWKFLFSFFFNYERKGWIKWNNTIRSRYIFFLVSRTRQWEKNKKRRGKRSVVIEKYRCDSRE